MSTTSSPVLYRSAHTRIQYRRGKAAQFDCMVCFGPAHEWAYNGQDPEELLGRPNRDQEHLATYSADPAYYEPMCRSHHRASAIAEKRGLVRDIYEYARLLGAV